jgi:hypothetical protein
MRLTAVLPAAYSFFVMPTLSSERRYAQQFVTAGDGRTRCARSVGEPTDISFRGVVRGPRYYDRWG